MVYSESPPARSLLAVLLLIALASCACSSGPVLTLNVTHPGTPPEPCNDYGHHAFTLRPVNAPNMATRVMPRVTTGGDHIKLTAVAGDDRLTPGLGAATRDGKRMITMTDGALLVWDIADLTLRHAIPHYLTHEELPLMLTPDGRTGMFKTKTGLRRVDLMSGEITEEDKGEVWSLPIVNHKFPGYPQPPITKSPRPRALDGYKSDRWDNGSAERPAPRAWLFPDGERWLSLQGFNYASVIGNPAALQPAVSWYADRWELSVNPVSTDASTGPIQLAINGRSALVDVAPSANGRALAALTAGLHVWSTDTGEILGEVADVGGADKVALSPDGSAAVTWFSPEFENRLLWYPLSARKSKASTLFVTVWDVRSGKARWRKSQGFVNAMEFTGTGRYLVQTFKDHSSIFEPSTVILDPTTGLEKFRPNVFVGRILPSSDILVISDDNRTSLLSIDTQSYLTSAPDGHVVALFPGATHFVASVSGAGDMRMFGNGKCVKLRVPESARLFFGKTWPGSKTLSAQIRIGIFDNEPWRSDERPRALAVWQANDGVLTTLLKGTADDKFHHKHDNHIPPEVEYRSSQNPGGYFAIDPITGGVGPFRYGEAIDYADRKSPEIRVKLGDAGPNVSLSARTGSVTRTRRGTLALTTGETSGPYSFWVYNQSDGHAVNLLRQWSRSEWHREAIQTVQFSPSGNLVAIASSHRSLIFDTRTGALLAELDFGPRYDAADVIAFADPARELLVYTRRNGLVRFSLDESFPP